MESTTLAVWFAASLMVSIISVLMLVLFQHKQHFLNELLSIDNNIWLMYVYIYIYGITLFLVS